MDSTDLSSRDHPKRRALLLLCAAILAIGGGLLVWRFVAARPKQPRWLTQKVTRGGVAQVVNATGTLQPVVLSPVGAQVSGIVYKIHADYNNLVKKGQILVELDPALFQAAVRREEANLASAQAALSKARADAQNATLVATRARALVEKHYIAAAERDAAVAQESSARANVLAAEAGIKQAQAALDKARLDLKNSVILSPVDGIVIARNVELGQAVVASFQAPNLFTIAEDLRHMQVLANVDEADIGHVHLDQTADFTVDAFRGRHFSARVAQIRNAAQTVSNVVTYIVVLEVNNEELLLRPGMTANVRLEVARRKNALLIPAAALRFKPRLIELSGSQSAAGEAPKEAGDARRGLGSKSEGGENRREGWRRRRTQTDKPQETPDGGVREKTGQPAEIAEEKGMPATVYVPDGERIAPVPITIGISDGIVTEVKEGLQEDQVVVVDSAKPAAGSNGGSGGPRPPGMGGGGFRRGGM